MAKLNKIMPPRNTTIRGQDHLLAYITPEEAQMLMDNGGAGKAGPMGIPAFYDEGDDYTGPGGNDSTNDFGLSDNFGGENLESAKAAAARAAEANLVQSILERGATQPSSMTAAEMAFQQTPAAQRIAQSYIDGRGVFGPEVFSANRFGGSIPAALRGGGFSALMGVPSYSNYFDDPAVNQAFSSLLGDTFESRMEQAKSIPGKLGAIGQFSLGRIKSGLEKGGRPVFDSSGKLQGVFNEGPFGFGEVYTGMPVEGVEGTGYDDGGRDGYEPEVKPVNPETGQCDEGYMFDEDMQACRLDTGYQAAASTGGAFGAPGDAYARMGLLDQAPTGLPQFQQRYGAGFGSPTDFAAANTAFRRQGAYRPEYFDQPYPTTGYTLLS